MHFFPMMVVEQGDGTLQVLNQKPFPVGGFDTFVAVAQENAIQTTGCVSNMSDLPRYAGEQHFRLWCCADRRYDASDIAWSRFAPQPLILWLPKSAWR